MLSKADLHIHTNYSFDSMASPESVLSTAVKKGLNVIAITDHDCIDGALKTQEIARQKELNLDVIVGEEISTKSGHVLGLFLKKIIPPSLSLKETIKRIKAQNGVVIIPHLSFRKRTGLAEQFNYQVHINEILEDQQILANIDALEAENFTMFDNKLFSNVKKYAHKLNKALVGNSDAHMARHIASAYTTFPGRSLKDLRQAFKNKTTKVFKKRLPTTKDWILHNLPIIKTPFSYLRQRISQKWKS